MGNRWGCEGYRPVVARDASEAAKVFGNRLARHVYGRRGYCRNVRADSWTGDGKSHTFEVFVGTPVPGDAHACQGHNEWLIVRFLGREG